MALTHLIFTTQIQISKMETEVDKIHGYKENCFICSFNTSSTPKVEKVIKGNLQIPFIYFCSFKVITEKDFFFWLRSSAVFVLIDLQLFFIFIYLFVFHIFEPPILCREGLYCIFCSIVTANLRYI